MLETYFWICTRCNKEREAYHGSVFNPPKHCGVNMKVAKMDNNKLKERNLKLLKDKELLKALRKDVIVDIIVQTYGGNTSKFSKQGKPQLLQYIEQMQAQSQENNIIKR